MISERTARMEKWFGSVGKLTIGAVLFLILVGGIVRSTGAGMGCPDWPKCFGMWVPPTDVSQLPANYQEIYADHGYGSMAFNVTRTWTEYLNRLVGALIGIFVFGTAVLSLQFRKSNPRIAAFSIGAFLLTGLEGWLGAKVVDLNLAGWMVTIHMLLAFVIVMLLIMAIQEYNQREGIKKQALPQLSALMKYMPLILLLLVVVQIVLGTFVRENVDLAATALGETARGEWLASVGWVFDLHRIFFLIPTVVLVLMAKKYLEVFEDNDALHIRRNVMLLIGLFFAEIFAGIVLGSFDLPFWLQPIHLLLASFIVAVDFSIFYALYLNERVPQTTNTRTTLKPELVS